MQQLIGVAVILGLLLFLFLNRKQQSRLATDPDTIWKQTGFNNLDRKKFEVWSSRSYVFTRTRLNDIHYFSEINFTGTKIEVTINGDSLLNTGTNIQFKKNDKTLGAANVTKDFFRAFDFILIWEDQRIEVPFKGDILRNNEVIGRVGRYGIEGNLLLAFHKSVEKELRASIYCLCTIQETDSRPT